MKPGEICNFNNFLQNGNIFLPGIGKNVESSY